MSTKPNLLKEASTTSPLTDEVRDVLPGFRRTEVGVTPKDWEVRPLGSTVAGLWAGISVNSIVDDLDSDNDEPAILKTSSVQSGSFFPYEAKRIAPKDHSRAKLNPCRNTILISRMNTIDLVGECGFVDRDYPNLFIPDRLWMTQFASKQPISACWLSCVLSSEAYRKRLQAIATGTSGSMKNISKKSLLELPIAFPSYPEQCAIAEALADVDGLIAALDKMIAKKRAIKQAAMQQLLTGKTRLPGFSGKWETKRLGELGHFLKGSGVTRDSAQSGALACVRYGEIYNTHHDYIRTFHSWISAEVAASATRLERGDLLFAGSGETKEEIGKCVAFVDDGEAYAGGDIVILRPRGADSLFLGYALNTPEVNRQKASRGQGDAVVHISAAALAQIELRMPKTEEQAAIAAVFSDMDAEIEALERRREKTHAIKQGMMQQLLTGRVRLDFSKPSGG
jgi:type I restriction enzyme, S subunit